MRKILLTGLLSVMALVNAMAQAVLPTSWSFTTTSFPTGWSSDGIGSYTASGNTPPAAKLDSSGDWVQINYAGAAGNLSYYLAGNSFAGGTFLVQESVDGTTWTTLRTHTALANGSYVQYNDLVSSASRYVRFFYQTKVTGNVGLDDVILDPASASPEQEINVKYNGTTVISSGTIYVNSAVGTASTFNLAVENNGLVDPLQVSAVTLTGVNASDYTIVSQPSSVNALSSSNIQISFNPATAGYRNAILTITNNDTDEGTYVVNLNGIGGTYATEPTNQATALVFPVNKTYRINGSFTAATSSPEGYLVLRSIGAPISTPPADGVVYQRGDLIGNAQVISSSTSINFSPSHVIAGTTYYFAVYTYNGPAQFRNYNTTAPLLGNVTTPTTMMAANYYNNIDPESATFMTDLKALTNPHQVQYYSNYGVNLISKYLARDTAGAKRVITCVYSGENKVYTEPWDFSSNNYSREHTFCHSWMPTNPAQDLPEYSDYHHLYPTNQNQVNGLRSNYPLGEVVNVQQTYMGAKYGTDANGKIVFEPRDEHKGDAARALFYMVTTYNGVNNKTWKLPTSISNSIVHGQDQAVLKKWHWQDLPNAEEMSRHDFIDSLQGNRNPFIDNPEFACFINFSAPAYIPEGCELGIEEQLAANFSVYPNPASNKLYINIDGTTLLSYAIFDIQGREVRKEELNVASVAILNVSQLSKGSYILSVETNYGKVSKQIIIE